MLKFEKYVEMASRAVAAIDYPASPAGLYEPIAYTMSLGGKRLRPVLVLMACDAFAGGCGRAVDAAVGIELYHNFTLLHDDVMDRADLRRGQLTVHVKWNDNTAILSGDAMLTMAGQYMTRTPAEVLPRVLDVFNRTAMEVYEGVVDYLKNFNVSDRDMNKFIIGTMSSLDRPMNPAAKGARSMNLYMNRVSEEMLRSERGQILDAQQEDIRALADVVKAMLDQKLLCVIGSEEKIEEQRGMFLEVRTLS